MQEKSFLVPYITLARLFGPVNVGSLFTPRRGWYEFGAADNASSQAPVVRASSNTQEGRQ